MVKIKYFWLYIVGIFVLFLISVTSYYVYTYQLTQFNKERALEIVEVAKSTAIITGVFMAIYQLHITYQTRFKDISSRNKKYFKEHNLETYRKITRKIIDRGDRRDEHGQTIEVVLDPDDIHYLGYQIARYIKSSGEQYYDHLRKCMSEGKVLDHENLNIRQVVINDLRDLYTIRQKIEEAIVRINKYYEEGIQIIQKIKNGEMNHQDKEELICDFVQERFWSYLLLVEDKMNGDFPLLITQISQVGDPIRYTYCSNLLKSKILSKDRFYKVVKGYINPIKPRIEKQIKELSVIKFYFG